MIGLARRKARLLGVPASFLVGDVVAPPPELAASADLVYTGKGALPWIMDLDGWGEAVVRILRPGGRVYVFDGHPLANLWDRESDTPRLRPEVGYFDPEPRENPGFPGSVVRRELGDEGPGMLERFWRSGEVIGSLLRAGCVLEAFDEHPYPFWDQFPGWSAEIGRRLPSTYSVLARLP